MGDLKILGSKIHHLVYYFTIYSFAGWCIESVYFFATEGKFVNRGFLNGPICPIYGFAAIFLLILLHPLKGNILLFFLGSVFITSALEYITALILEIFFNSIQWDYSSQPFNLKGRICLKFSLAWGLFAVIFLLWLHPYIHQLTVHIPKNLTPVISCMLVLYFLVDCTATFIANSDPILTATHLDTVRQSFESMLSDIIQLTTEQLNHFKEKLNHVFSLFPYQFSIVRWRKTGMLLKQLEHIVHTANTNFAGNHPAFFK